MSRIESVVRTRQDRMPEIMTDTEVNGAASARGKPKRHARILLIMECKICREGIRVYLAQEFDVQCASADGRDVQSAASGIQSDVVVIEIPHSNHETVVSVERIKSEQPGAKLIFLASREEPHDVVRALEVGASGYVLMRSEPSELLDAIREILQGRTYISPLIPSDTIASYQRRPGRSPHSGALLTPRQEEVLQLLAEGRTAREVGEQLHISPRTVEFHKYKMMDKLGLGRSAELVQYAIQHGIVDP